MSKVLQKDDDFKALQKNIIYGNPIINKYGKFRCFCCPISSKNYLKTNKSFSNYNKFVSAYRISQTSVPFMTQNESAAEEYVEGFFDDTTLEGSGEKLLHLLQKFNIENVLLMIGIEQFSPLAIFETSYFHIMVKKSKELLNSLYTKVLQFELPTENNLRQETVKSAQYRNQNRDLNFSLPNHEKKSKGYRPNYFASEMKEPITRVLRSVKISPKEIEKRKIEKRMNELIYNIEKIINSFEEPDYIQMKFLSQYENDPLIMKVFKLVMILEDYEKRDQFLYEYDFEKGIQKLNINKMNKKKLKKLNDMIRQEKRMNYDVLLLINPTIANLFQLIFLIIKSYDNILSLEKIKTSIEKENERESREEDDPQAMSTNKNSQFSFPVLDSNVIPFAKKQNKNSLPRLHDRHPSSVKNFRYMLLRNQELLKNSYY